jgi:hypothetical protein
MSTEVLRITDAPGNAVFFVVWNAAGQVLDQADNTFRALGSATTPGLAASENTNKGGVLESAYEASQNLAYLNSTPAILAFNIEAYRRAGGTVNLANDLLLDSQEFRVAASVLTEGSIGEVIHGYTVRCGFNVTSTAGTTLQLYAILEKDGKPVTLAGTETCVFTCYEFTETLVKFPSPAAVTPTANGQFETTVTNPALVDDTEYILKATITIGAVTVTGTEILVVVGGA